jgi:hypothetical protein
LRSGLLQRRRSRTESTAKPFSGSLTVFRASIAATGDTRRMGMAELALSRRGLGAVEVCGGTDFLVAASQRELLPPLGRARN